MRRRSISTLVTIVGTAGGVWLSVHSGPLVASTSAASVATPHNGPLTVIDSVGSGSIYIARRHSRGKRLFHCGYLKRRAHDCVEIESLAWAPDGHHLAFGATSVGLPASHDGLFVADTRTGRATRIRPYGRTETAWLDVAWSPTGSTIAFTSGANTIALIHPDGTGYRVLDTGSEGHDHGPTWSPGGRRLAYSTSVGGRSAVFAIDLDGRHRTLVARGGGWPAWSPDGRRIAYATPCGVRLISPAGTGRSRCLGVDGSPVWSPDGREIAMAIFSKGIYKMRADGTRLRRYSTVSARSVASGSCPIAVPHPPAHACGPDAGSWSRPAWVPIA